MEFDESKVLCKLPLHPVLVAHGRWLRMAKYFYRPHAAKRARPFPSRIRGRDPRPFLRCPT